MRWTLLQCQLRAARWWGAGRAHAVLVCCAPEVRVAAWRPCRSSARGLGAVGARATALLPCRVQVAAFCNGRLQSFRRRPTSSCGGVRPMQPQLGPSCPAQRLQPPPLLSLPPAAQVFLERCTAADTRRAGGSSGADPCQHLTCRAGVPGAVARRAGRREGAAQRLGLRGCAQPARGGAPAVQPALPQRAHLPHGVREHHSGARRGAAPARTRPGSTGIILPGHLFCT